MVDRATVADARPAWLHVCSCGRPMTLEHIHPLGNPSRICLECRIVKRLHLSYGGGFTLRPVKPILKDDPDP